MRQKDHEQVIKGLADRHRETVRALEARIEQLKADRTTLDQVARMSPGVSRGLAHMAVQNGLAAHAVYKVGDTVTFLLFQDHESFDLWVRAESDGRTVGAFHGSDIR